MAFAKAIAFTVALTVQSARVAITGELAGRGQSFTIAGVQVHNYQPNNKEWIVLFKEGTSDWAIQKWCKGICDFQGHPSAKGVGFAKIHAGESFLASVLTKTLNKIDIDFIETDVMDYIIPEIEVGQDNALLAEMEKSQAASWGLDRIGVSSAATTGKGVNIYVQDTGIRTTHTDFGGRASSAYDMSASGKECRGAISCAVDRQGHGSHCAGTAGGATFGVAPNAKIFAVKTMSDDGSGQRSWQYGGIDWVATKGDRPTVLSMSLGGSGKDPSYNLALRAAANSGVVVVTAAGNSDAETCEFSPAYSPFSITVGATDAQNVRASYSNYGQCNDIFAPGSGITSVSSSDDSGSRTLSGTSMACPHVAGAAALLLETNPGLHKDQILEMLKFNAKRGFISGLKRKDPDYFLFVAGPPAPVPPPPPPAPPAPSCRRRLFFCNILG